MPTTDEAIKRWTLKINHLKHFRYVSTFNKSRLDTVDMDVVRSSVETGNEKKYGDECTVGGEVVVPDHVEAEHQKEIDHPAQAEREISPSGKYTIATG